MKFKVGDIVKLKEFTKNKLWLDNRLNNDLCSYGVIDKVGPSDWYRIVFKNTRRRFKKTLLSRL